MGKRSRVQYVRLRVSFEKEVSPREAATIVASAIKGEPFYGWLSAGDDELDFTVRSVSPLVLAPAKEPSHG